MSEDKIVIPVSSHRVFPYRSPIASDNLNGLHQETRADIIELASAVNSINTKLTRAILSLEHNNQYLRRQVDALRNQQDYQEKVAAINNLLITRYIDFGNTEGLYFPNDLDDTRSAMLNAEFGEISLPVNYVENKFYSTSIRSGRIVQQPNLEYVVKGTFDKGLGEGLVNYERGGKVYEGDVSQAFNGLNDKYWIRKVEFPIDSRIDQVECELTVIVPQGTSSKANLLELIPFPNGSLDVTEIAISSDLSTNFTRVPGFEPKDNMVAKRYHFPATTVDQIKVRLKQRNWIEENGKKVFYYGLQELSLKLVDYDKTYTYGAPFGSNNSFIYRIEAPEGYVFTSIQRVDPTPNFLLEDPSSRHIHMRIGSLDTVSNGIVWNSDTDLAPQDLATAIPVGTDTLYAFFELNYVASSGGILSPYLVGTTPYISGFGLSFTLIKS